MAKVIAVVRLAPGQVAWYDETTSLHMTMGNPMAEVLDYMNTTKIKRAVHNKILNLVTGSFDVDNIAVPKEQKVNIEVKPKEVKVEEPKVEKVEVIEEVRELKVEAPAEKIEEVVEEEVTPVEETEETTEAKPKSKRKKKED